MREAARALGVSSQRIYQFLYTGRLQRRRRRVIVGSSVERLLKIRKAKREK